MATGPGFPGQSTVYIPNWEASGRLAVAYSRNAKDFPLMRWIKLTKSPHTTGYYLKLSAQEAARIVSTNDYLWGWGAQRPDTAGGLEQFNFLPFTVQRFAPGFDIDDDTEQQASWEIGEQHAKIYAAKAMTLRTIRTLSVATTAANWQTAADPDMSSDHTATAAAFVGGFLDQGTSINPLVKKFFDKASVLIDLETLGTVKPDQLHCIMNPNTARLIAESPEIHDYIKGSPDAEHEIRTGGTPNSKYGPGLPSTLYGMDVIVDNTVKITTRRGYPSTSNPTKTYAFPDQAIMICSRPGELEGVYGTHSFSTFEMFWYRDEMTLERFNDPINRRTRFSIVDTNVPVLVSPISGYYLTSATSVAS